MCRISHLTQHWRCMQGIFFSKKIANSDILQGKILQNFHATWKVVQNFHELTKLVKTLFKKFFIQNLTLKKCSQLFVSSIKIFSCRNNQWITNRQKFEFMEDMYDVNLVIVVLTSDGEPSIVFSVILLLSILLFTYGWKWRHVLHQKVEVPLGQLYLTVDLKNTLKKYKINSAENWNAFQNNAESWWNVL